MLYHKDLKSPFLEELNADYLQIECRTLIERLSSSYPSEHGNHPELWFTNTAYAIITAPFDKATLQEITQVENLLRKSWSSTWSSELILARMQHMHLVGSLWAWADVECRHAAQASLKGSPHPPSWIAKLAKDVHMTITTRRSARDFLSSSYLDMINLNATYNYANERPCFLLEEEAIKRSEELVVEIILCWFRLARRPQDRLPARFIGFLLQAFPPSILALDLTWNAFNNVSTQVFGVEKVHLPHLCDWQPFRKAITQHPVFVSGSFERKLLIWCWHPLVASGFAPTPIELEDAKLVVERSKLHSLLLYLREVALTLEPEPEWEWKTSLHAHIETHQNKMLPFRERAPFRVAQTGGDGPLLMERITTNEGLFSLLVARGITFGTLFFQEASKQMFEGWEDLNEEAEKFSGQSPTFFCDKAAYGLSNRSFEDGEAYWTNTVDASHTFTSQWHDLVRTLPIPFVTAKDFLSKPASRFPNIGELTALLTIGDLVYAGIVVAPSVEEMGTIVASMDKGAANLLVRIGLVERPVVVQRENNMGKTKQKTKGKLDKKRTAEAFETSFAHLQRFATEQEKIDWGFDVIMTEHSECKCQKAVGYGLYTL